MNDLVSVVMATYNGEKFLRLQIESILNQSYSNLEVIVVDDCSTDSTMEILHEYASQDLRIKIFPAEKNFGLVANFERGIKLAKGEFIALSDQDDIFDDNKIEVLRSALIASNGCDLVVSDLRLIDGEGKIIADSMWSFQDRNGDRKGNPFRRLVYDNFATGCAMMFTRRIRDLAVPFPKECLVHDWWLALVASCQKGRGIILVEQKLAGYRQHGSNQIGASKSEPYSLVKVLKRIFATSRGLDKVILQNKDFELHLKRTRSYLERSELWSPREVIVINQVARLFEEFITDDRCNLLQQIAKVPLRFRYALMTGNKRRVVDSVFYCLFPFK